MSNTSSASVKATNELPSLNQDILTLLFEIRMELRVLNTLIAETLNSRADLDQLRQDPYYNGAGGTNTDSLPDTITR